MELRPSIPIIEIELVDYINLINNTSKTSNPGAVAEFSFIRNTTKSSTGLIFYINKFTSLKYLYIS